MSLQQSDATVDAGAVDDPESFIRDVRVDQLGFVGELTKRHSDPLKTAIKLAMANKAADRCRGDFFAGLLVTPQKSEIDPGAFLRKFEKGEITRAQFVACLTIRRKPAEEYFSGQALDSMSRDLPSTPSLTVTRLKGVEPTLVDAVRELGASIK